MPKAISETIQFFKEDIHFRLPPAEPLRSWLRSVALAEGSRLATLNYIFCSDRYLRRINKVFLAHDYFTDVITFDNSEDHRTIEGDIFISVDRVRANASDLKESFASELRRVMVHGLLHLLEYSDKTVRTKKIMRRKEDEYLSLW
jgi:probable rRNA maturation factor